jgi:methylglutaconyl-CoA hydratase
MNKEHLIIKKLTPEVILVSLNRPDKRNALNTDIVEELCLTFEELPQHPDHRVILLTGEGPSFCAGLDLSEALNPLLEQKSAHLIARLLASVYSSPLMTIAAVHGAAIGGGAGLLAACDLAVAAKNTKIGFPEARRGLVAAQVAVFLARQIPMRAVRELLLLGELINGDQALSLGLINRSVKPDDVMKEALALAEQALKCAPRSIKETKQLLESLDPTRFADDLEIAMSFHHSARKSQEAKEGIAAFLEKRSPQWEKHMR